MRFLRETLALAGLAFQIGILGVYWNALPARVPTHYGLNGAPDDYGAKATLLTLPLVAIAIYGLLTTVSFFPQRFNYPVAVTEQNRERLQAIAGAMMGWLKAEVTWIFAYIGGADIRVALGVSSGLGWAFLPLMLSLVGATIAIAVVQMRRAG